MPKFMLKKFVDSKGRLYAYDFKNKYNSYSTPSSINTKQAYYSEGAEQILNQQVETPFSKVVNKICDADFKNQFEFTADDSLAVYRFLFSLVSRDQEILKGVEGKSAFFWIFGEQVQHDLIAIKGIDIVEQTGILQKYDWTILVNISRIPFILSTNGMYSFAIENKEHDIEQYIVLPLCEDKAILLYEKKYESKFNKGEFKLVFSISEKEINFFNKTATIMQKKKGYGYIVSSNKELIDELVNQYCK